MNVSEQPYLILCLSVLRTVVHCHSLWRVLYWFVASIASISEKLTLTYKKPYFFCVSGMAQSLPDRNLVGEITWLYLDSLYAMKNKSKTNGVHKWWNIIFSVVPIYIDHKHKEYTRDKTDSYY